MKSVAGPLAIAVVFAVAGGAFWLVGRTETRIAEMHKQLATLHYDDAESEGEAVEESLGLERRVPMVGRAAETDVRDTRAAAGYWRTDYDAIAPRRDANGVVTETDPAILFLSANAGFRASQGATDRGDLLRRLDNVVKTYGEVLKAEAGACSTAADACEMRAMDAAYNYSTPSARARPWCAAAGQSPGRRRRMPRSKPTTKRICRPDRRCTDTRAARRRRPR